MNSLLSGSPSALAVADSVPILVPRCRRRFRVFFAFHLIKARINLPQGSYAEGITTRAWMKLYCLIDKARVMFLFCMHNLFEIQIFHFSVTPGDKAVLWVCFFFLSLTHTLITVQKKELEHSSSPLTEPRCLS